MISSEGLSESLRTSRNQNALLREPGVSSEKSTTIEDIDLPAWGGLHLKMPKLITFDVTNTLLKFRVPTGHQYASTASLYGVKADPGRLTAAFNTEWVTFNKKHPNFGVKTGVASSADWWTQLVGRTFQSAGYPLDAKRLTDISTHLIRIFKTGSCWQVRSGTEEALASLRKGRGEWLPCLGVISNFDDSLPDVLRNTGLLSLFDFVLASYDCRVYKPQAEIFNLALGKVGNKCLPEEAVHVGDDLFLDYWGAKNAGWNAFLLTPEAQTSTSLKSTSTGKGDVQLGHSIDPSSVIANLTDLVAQISRP